MLTLKLDVKVWRHGFLLALRPCLSNHSLRLGIALLIHVLHNFHESSARIIFAATEIHIVFQFRLLEIGQTFFGWCQVRPFFAYKFIDKKTSMSLQNVNISFGNSWRCNYLRLLSWHRWQRSWFWFSDSCLPHQCHAIGSSPQTCDPYCAHWSLSAESNSVWMSPRHFLLPHLERHQAKWRTSRIYHFDPKRSCWSHIHIVWLRCWRCVVLVFQNLSPPIEHEDSLFQFRCASSESKLHQCYVAVSIAPKWYSIRPNPMLAKCKCTMRLDWM